MKDTVLKKLQQTETEILKEVVKICDKYKINYFLLYGTLLGAVRHKGFIPWDDDIDIAMPREDYNLFIEKAKIELNGKYQLDYIENNKNYYLNFIKVRNINTSYEEYNLKGYSGNKGIWIDIFPLDYADKIGIEVKMKNKIVKVLSKILSYKSINLKKNNVIFNFLIKITKIIPNKFFINFVTNILTNKKDNGKYLISHCDFDPLKLNIYETNDIFPLSKIEFENNDYNVPNNYKRVLESIYGSDYMELPPIEKRKTHNPLKIVFKDLEEYEFSESNK